MSQTNRIDESFYVRGVKCAAWLYLPANHSQGPVPAVVIGHGLGGVREWRLDNFAQAFRAAGYACLVFDYRGFVDNRRPPVFQQHFRFHHLPWGDCLRSCSPGN